MIFYSKHTFILKSILVMLFMSFTQSLLPQSQPHSVQRYVDKETIAPSRIVVDVRIPSETKIEEYRKDSRFQYEEEESAEWSWFNRLKYWLFQKILELLDGTAKSGLPTIIIILAIVGLIFLIILKLMGVKFKTLFGRKKLDTPEIDIYTENVHEMNFDTLIKTALANKDYRLAVRFLYLKNLKTLSDKSFIKWSVNKTNYSYQHEISDMQLRSRFIETTFIFDYVWYGEFVLDESKFLDIEARMNYFNEMANNER